MSNKSDFLTIGDINRAMNKINIPVDEEKRENPYIKAFKSINYDMLQGKSLDEIYENADDFQKDLIRGMFK